MVILEKLTRQAWWLVIGVFKDKIELIEGSARKFVLYEVDSFDNI